MNAMQFRDAINTLRLANREKWFFWTGDVCGRHVEVKCFNTWLQIFRIDGMQQNTTMDITPTAFKSALLAPFASMNCAAQ